MNEFIDELERIESKYNRETENKEYEPVDISNLFKKEEESE